MNTIHKFSMAIVAVVMIAGFSAFKMSESILGTNVVTKTWYFTGDDESQVTLPEHYTDNPNEAPDCDEEKEIICTILVPDNGNGEPDLSLPGVQDLIDDAMATGDLNSVVRSFRSLE